MELVKMLERDRTGAMLDWSNRASVKIAHAFTAGSTTRRLPSKKTARMGDKAKPPAASPHHPAALLCLGRPPQVTKLITPEWDLAFFWSWRCRAYSKLFALLLRTLATKPNLTLLIALVHGVVPPRARAFSRPDWPRRAPKPRRGFFACAPYKRGAA